MDFHFKGLCRMLKALSLAESGDLEAARSLLDSATLENATAEDNRSEQKSALQNTAE